RLPMAHGGLGVVAMHQGRIEDAFGFFSKSLAGYAERGQVRGVAMATHNLGTIESMLGAGDHGRARFESALTMFREVGDGSTEALCLSALVAALVRLGDLDAARQRMRECLRLLERLETARESAYTLDAVVELLLAVHQPLEAARIVGAAEVARKTVGLPR